MVYTEIICVGAIFADFVLTKQTGEISFLFSQNKHFTHSILSILSQPTHHCYSSEPETCQPRSPDLHCSIFPSLGQNSKKLS